MFNPLKTFYKMEKFIKITNAPITNALISVNGIKSIGTATATATTVVIKYADGTATTVTTSAQVGHLLLGLNPLQVQQPLLLCLPQQIFFHYQDDNVKTFAVLDCF